MFFITLPDHTAIIQVISYFILLFLVNKFLYRPIVEILEERKAKTTGATGEADEINKSIEEGLADYEKSLKDAAVRAQEDRAKTRQAAVKEEQSITDSARKEAVAELENMRAELEKEKASALETLKKDAEEISKTISEKILERAIALVLAFTVLLSIPTDAHAAGGFNAVDLGWKVAVFIPLVYLLYWAWKKHGVPAIDQRTEDIKNALEAAQIAKEKAETELAKYKAKVADLDSKVKSIEDSIRSEAEAEKARIIKEAQASAEKIKEQAKLTASQEVKKAKIELKAAAAELAVELAEKTLVKEVTDADQKKQASGYIEKIKLN